MGFNRRKIGLVGGISWVSTMDFYRKQLELQRMTVLIPEKQETRDYIQQTLRDELGVGLISAATRAEYISIASGLIEAGAECILLGCTEIPLLIGQADFSVPVLDMTSSHIS